jgi:hypothetical protein
MDEKNNAGKHSLFKTFLTILYGCSLIVFFYFLFAGISYYLSPYGIRPHHLDYRALRPAGPLAHGFGVIGSAMMILMLSYSLRKRFKMFQSWGVLNRWLSVHIYFGIIGPLYIILHTSFKIQGLVAVSFWSMVAVVLSGVLGRYIYLQIPRNNEGGELTIGEIEEMQKRETQRLREEYHLDDKQMELIHEASTTPINIESNPWLLILVSIRNDIWQALTLKKRISHIISKLNLPISLRKNLWRTIRQKAKLERRVLLLTQMQKLFHYWHVIHKPFAVVMYLIMVIHVSVAIWLGYTWIF